MSWTLVVTPRAIADPGESGSAWAVRFLLLLPSLALGDLLFGAAGWRPPAECSRAGPRHGWFPGTGW